MCIYNKSKETVKHEGLPNASLSHGYESDQIIWALNADDKTLVSNLGLILLTLVNASVHNYVFIRAYIPEKESQTACVFFSFLNQTPLYIANVNTPAKPLKIPAEL